MSERWILGPILLLLLVVGVLAQPIPLGEAGQSPVPPTLLPIVAPADPPPPLLPDGLAVDGLSVGGLTLEQARALLEEHRLAPFYRPLTIHLGEQTRFPEPAHLGLSVGLDQVLDQLQGYLRSAPVEDTWTILLSPNAPQVVPPVRENLPLPVSLDRAPLLAFLDDLARSHDRMPLPAHVSTLTDTAFLEAAGVQVATWAPDEPVRAFFQGKEGRRLDREAALRLLEAALLQRNRDPVTLPVETVTPPPLRLNLLEGALRPLLRAMPGVVGLYVRDLESGQEAGINEQVVFSGASVIKIAIMLQTYRILDAPPEGRVAQDLWAMMVYSDNDAANRLLAFGGGGNAIAGATAMTDMLRQLGLEASFMRGPYGSSRQSARWLSERAAGLSGPPRQGAVTDADPWLQTTPREMGLLLSYLDACAQGQGPLPAHFSQITPAECVAMLSLMEQNADHSRMVAGLPTGTPCAHKSGWVSDMKADAGIVRSPGGDYVLSVFVWEKGYLSDARGNPRIAAISWLTYTFFNPLERR